ncbi:hypothetical protein EHP00_313 [Ecytonucleospora hepatopenaei]|uniref:Uncharacterized protein n=1 Tax=Ecytonucleospora hepatopenaei TaxID=646526 RepID=A0A1W0E757_9MICR|nr:hypothetical protein EHP00_313 [Ecytonucleospora hepatopenaei]
MVVASKWFWEESDEENTPNRQQKNKNSKVGETKQKIQTNMLLF